MKSAYVRDEVDPVTPKRYQNLSELYQKVMGKDLPPQGNGGFTDQVLMDPQEPEEQQPRTKACIPQRSLRSLSRTPVRATGEDLADRSAATLVPRLPSEGAILGARLACWGRGLEE